MLIFYAWTAVVSVGCLIFLVQPWRIAIGIMVAGFLVCALLTAAPVSRRVWQTALRVMRERRAARRGLEPTIDAHADQGRRSLTQGDSR